MVFAFRFTREEDKNPPKTAEQQQKFLASLPECPSKDRLVMIVRDAHCTFAYPAFEKRTKDKIRSIYGNNDSKGYLEIKKKLIPLLPYFLAQRVKRYEFGVSADNPHPNLYFTENIESGRCYQAKLKIEGVKSLVSNVVKTPVDYVSSDTSCRFATSDELSK